MTQLIVGEVVIKFVLVTGGKSVQFIKDIAWNPMKKLISFSVFLVVVAV